MTTNQCYIQVHRLLVASHSHTALEYNNVVLKHNEMFWNNKYLQVGLQIMNENSNLTGAMRTNSLVFEISPCKKDYFIFNIKYIIQLFLIHIAWLKML